MNYPLDGSKQWNPTITSPHISFVGVDVDCANPVPMPNAVKLEGNY